MYRFSLLIISCLFSSLAIAHPGHDHNSITSGLVHFMWVLPAIVAIGLFVYYKRKVNTKTKNQHKE